MKTFFITDPGKIRSHNEDNVNIFVNKNRDVLMIVADGMGGHKAGEVASLIVVEQFKEEFKKIDSFEDKIKAVKWIRKVSQIANDKIFKYSDKHKEAKGLGTTLTLALHTKDYILFGNIGDSSGYAYNDKKLLKVTSDHTLINMLVKSGDLTEAEAKNHPKKNIVIRALGAINPIEIDIFDVEPGIDGILLCSDGLTTMLSDSQIEKVLNSKLTIEEKLESLIKKCNNRGGSDNISIAFLEIRSDK